MNSYQDFENFLSNLNKRPKLLLHSCCGPCSTAVLDLLLKYFDIDIYYYNPNIYPKEEYSKRLKEQERLGKELNTKVIETIYNNNSFKTIAKGLENELEGGQRCYKCIYQRMEQTCIYAKNNGYDYFSTTLSISPHKSSKMINEIGHILEEKYKILYLYSDFKKKDGYIKSIELSKKYNLYRQNYCGCQFSLKNSKNT